MIAFWRWVITASLVLMTLVGTSGCGGSSAGTGSKTYAGTIESRDGAPQPGVVVTIFETGQQVMTNELGQFVFEAVELQGDLTLIFSGPLVDDQLLLQGSDEGGDVTIDVVVNEETGDIEETIVTIQPKPSEEESSSSESSSAASSGSISSGSSVSTSSSESDDSSVSSVESSSDSSIDTSASSASSDSSVAVD